MTEPRPPLAGLRVVTTARAVAAVQAARMLATLGAEVTLAEPDEGSPLRREPPFLPDGTTSALFAYLASGMTSRRASPGTAAFAALLGEADVLIDDTPLGERTSLGLDEAGIAARYPALIHVSVLPFGAHGPKASWKGEDVTVQHASGEGYLLPNGLAGETFPDRAPIKIHGHFAALQGGTAAALAALSALWVREDAGGQFVDISWQDAMLAVGAFAIQRLGDGEVEHRVARSFRYGGVIACADGHVELLTLEQRQWHGLVRLLGNPEWARDPALDDPLERSRRGAEINRHIRAWAADRRVEEVVREGQRLGVPLAKYYAPADVIADPHERQRGLCQEVDVPGTGPIAVLVSPFHFDGSPLCLAGGPPA